MNKAAKALAIVALLAPLAYYSLRFTSFEKPSGKTVVRYMAWGYPAQLKTEQELIKLFEAQPENSDVQVEFSMTPMRSYYDKVQLMLASGTAPDVLRTNPDYFPAYAKLGFFKNLDPIMQADPDYHPEDYFPIARDRALYKGHHYGVGVLFTTALIYYNKTLFDKAGVETPWRQYEAGRWKWDEFLETAKKLTVYDDAGRPVQYGASLRLGTDTVSALVLAQGGGLVSEDGSKSLVNSPKSVAAVQWISDLVWKWHVSPTPSEGALQVFGFESGKMAMEYDSSGESPRLREAITAFEWDVAPTPAIQSGLGSAHNSHILVMSERTKVEAAAWRFMKFMTSPVAERMLGCKLRRCIPTLRALALSEEYLSADLPPYNMRAFVAGIDSPSPEVARDERYAEWSLEWQAHLDEALLGTKPAQQAMDEAAARIDLILQGETD